MPEMDISSTKLLQISKMFQKFALSFKTKTFVAPVSLVTTLMAFYLSDFAQDFITNQKIVVIKPGPACNFSPETTPSTPDPPVAKPPVESDVKKLKQTEKLSPLAQQTTVMKSMSESEFRAFNTQMSHTVMSSMFAMISSLAFIADSALVMATETKQPAEDVKIDIFEDNDEFEEFEINEGRICQETNSGSKGGGRTRTRIFSPQLRSF